MTMKTCRLMVLLILCGGSMAAQAQLTCIPNGQPLPLVCLIPFSTSATLGGGGASNVAAAAAINGSIGAELSQLPVAVSAPGTAFLVVNGNPQVFDNLGPILIDRPDSVGRWNVVFGFSFQQFNFNHLDGIGLGSVPFAYSVPTSGGSEYVAQTQHISFKYNQYVALATIGLPKSTDVTVIVPFARVSIGAAALNQTTYNLNASGDILSHTDLTPIVGYQPASSNGIGDVSFNVKHVLWSGGESGRGALAAGMLFRLPTGDALNYLGSGAYGYNLYALASYKAQFSPHVKVAYQWNTNSVLLNPTGSSSITNTRLPGGAQYSVGADYGISRHLTLSADVLANQSANANSLAISPITLNYATPPSPAPSPAIFKQVSSVQNTYTAANLSFGLKVKPFRRKPNFVLYGNVLLQLNDVGLRSDPSPSGGISYSFK
jgi:hypothetical protein